MIEIAQAIGQFKSPAKAKGPEAAIRELNLKSVKAFLEAKPGVEPLAQLLELIRLIPYILYYTTVRTCWTLHLLGFLWFLHLLGPLRLLQLLCLMPSWAFTTVRTSWAFAPVGTSWTCSTAVSYTHLTLPTKA